MTAPWHARASLAALAVVALGGWEPFRTTDPDVEAGNTAYAEGRFDDALAAYDRAARRGGVDPDGLAFDRGTAELKKSEAITDPAEKRRLAERALEDLKQAARAKDPHIRGAAHYNRGNALMSQDRLADAIEAYKQALREDPDLDDARLNLELALRRRQKQQQKQQQQPQQGQQGQGQQRQPGQGKNQQGQGSNGSNEQGSGEQGSGDQGSNQQNGSNGQGSNQNGSNGQGSNQQNGSNGQGSDQNGSNGQGSDQNGSNGQGSNQNGSNQPGDQSGQNGQNPRGRSLRRNPQSPKTPTDGKLDDLDNYSRRLQKDEARRRATGKSTDPKHDW